MADSIRSSLPPIYSHLFDAFFDRPKVVETRATCENCAMCDHGQASPVAMEFFNSETKCCTFWPILPNYLVGAILADPSPEMAEGKRRLEAIIDKRVGVTSLHVARPRKMSLLMGGYSEVFGRARSMRCPFYDDANPAGTCSIWRHREVICMTYYCKYEGGVRGYEYWTALKDYLSHVQRTLAHNAARSVDSNVIEPKFKNGTLTLEDMEDLPPKESDYAAWWGPWVGREREFYLKCHEWVQNVSPKDFARNVDGSKEGEASLRALIAKYERLQSKTLPNSLIRNARMREMHVGDKVVVTSYHRFDSFALDKDLFEVVGLFRADQTLDENLARLKQDDGIELAPELIEFLFATGVLVEPAKPQAAAAGVSPEVSADLRARRAALGAVIEARGIEIDEATHGKIAEAEASKLETWIKRAAVARSLEEVLND